MIIDKPCPMSRQEPEKVYHVEHSAERKHNIFNKLNICGAAKQKRQFGGILTFLVVDCFWICYFCWLKCFLQFSIISISYFSMNFLKSSNLIKHYLRNLMLLTISRFSDLRQIGAFPWQPHKWCCHSVKLLFQEN